MIEKLEEKVRGAIEKHELFSKGDTIIVGFSGGPDSVCLLHVLAQMKNEWELDIHAVHMNHCLRPGDADEDEKYAEKFCRDLNIPFHAFRRDVNLLSKERKVTTEEAGRQVRYEAFEEVRTTLGGVGKIAVAHNMNDQAETILLRLIRGTGPDGLAAMDYKRDGGIIRPLLDVSREEIEEYCNLLKLKPQIDLSNLEPLYARNKIRLELIPLLEKSYNSNILMALIRLSTIATEDRDYFRTLLDEIKAKMVEEKEPFRCEIDRHEYRKLHPAVGKRLINSCLKGIGMDKDITAFHLDNADEMTRKGNVGEQMDFPLGFGLTLMYEKAALHKADEGKISERQESPSGFRYPLRIEGKTEIKEINVTIKSSLTEVGEFKSSVTESYESYGNKIVFLDYSAIQDPEKLVIRTRKPGDYIVPFGMTGKKKIQDYFVDKKIPKAERDEIPMLCLSEEVLWIPLLASSEKYKIKEGNTQILRLEIVHPIW